jgi:hypothetical protein
LANAAGDRRTASRSIRLRAARTTVRGERKERCCSPLEGDAKDLRGVTESPYTVRLLKPPTSRQRQRLPASIAAVRRTSGRERSRCDQVYSIRPVPQSQTHEPAEPSVRAGAQARHSARSCARLSTAQRVTIRRSQRTGAATPS